MKAHVANFFQFLEDNDGKIVPLRLKFSNPDKFKITKDELNVKGNLVLSNTNITSLPDGLYVGEYLELTRCTSLTSLPNGLHVGKTLYLTDCTSLKSLPNGLKVGESLHLENTPLAKMYSADEIRTMIESKGGYVGGNIYI